MTVHATSPSPRWLLLLFALPLSAAAAPRAAPLGADTAPAMTCAAAAKLDLTRFAEAPAVILDAAEGGPAAQPHCAVTGTLAPNVRFELRLPLDGWNGRYLQTGCGGFCGEVRIDACNDALADGFVTGAHDMGHVGGVIDPPVWGAVPELRVDYGGRATHRMAVLAKEIATRFYGAVPARSYLRGCSTGGREGLSEAQAHPEDFDGIIAGDPAFPGRLGAIANNWDARHLLRDDGSEVFAAQDLALLHSAVMAACDDLDGLADGILMDPRACDFDVRTLACADDAAAGCLSGEQVDAARALYDGPRNRDGVALMPGATPFGSEPSWSGRGRRALAEGYLRYLAFEENPPLDYDYRSFDFDADISRVEAAAALYDPVAPYRAPDLRAFSAAGGKLIVYHGWADAGVSPEAMLDYYAQVAARQGGIDVVQDFFRVYMVPGMFHCRGGDAPNQFDFLPALLRWVEAGDAPQAVIARQFDGDTLVRSRPLYPYPSFAVYTGNGDVNDAASWRSAQPDGAVDDRRDWLWAPRD